MVEYGLMIGLIAVLVIAIFVIMGGEMTSRTGMIQGTVGGEAVGEGQSALSAATYA